MLATIAGNGRAVEYHHIIYPLDAGSARRNGLAALTAPQLSDVIEACADAVRGLRREGSKTRLAVTNEKIFDAIASNGPRKDLCGAGFTILGINADGTLHPCASTMADARHELGALVDAADAYTPGTIERLWRDGGAAGRIRAFTAHAAEGPPDGDYRRFHGGGCWCHASDPGGDAAGSNPWLPMYEALTEKAILKCAAKGVSPDDEALVSPRPKVLRAMARSRIACAGVRKTSDLSRLGIDTGYCICFS
jgi:hypothetical protein